MPKPTIQLPRPFNQNHERLPDGEVITFPCSAVAPWTKEAQEAAHASGRTLAEIAAAMTSLGMPMTAQKLSLAFLNGRSRVSSFAGTFEVALMKLAESGERAQKLPADAAWASWARERMEVHGLRAASLARRSGVTYQQVYTLLRGEGMRSEAVAKLNAVLEPDPTEPVVRKEGPTLSSELDALNADLERLQTAFRRHQEAASGFATELVLVKRRMGRLLRMASKSSTLAE